MRDTEERRNAPAEQLQDHGVIWEKDSQNNWKAVEVKEAAPEIAEPKTDSGTKGQSEINRLMTTYARLKKSAPDSSDCKKSKVKAANMLYSDHYSSLLYQAKNHYHGRGVKEDFEDAVQETIYECMANYDPDKSDNFTAWLYVKLKYTVQNDLKKNGEKKYADNDGKQKDNAQDPDDEPESRNDSAEVRYVKKEVPIDENTPDPEGVENTIEKRMYLEQFYIIMYNCIVGINPNKYFRAFAAEKYIAMCHEKLNRVLDVNENEAFHIMDEEFLDGVLEKKNCRTFSAIEFTPCKFYEAFGLKPRYDEKRKKRRVCPPFENIIYEKIYDCSNSNISQERKKFNEKIFLIKKEMDKM